MIRFSQVTKRYRNGREALRAISFHVEPGEMCFLTGHSGAGKSTLLKLIMVMEKSTRGQVLINGQNLARLPNRRIPYLRRQIGMVYQDHKLLLDRTVFDNVALPLVVANTRHQDIHRRVRAAITKVGLQGKEKSFPMTLSGGEQQRVGIARAIVNKPDLLLADEPTGNLDQALSNEILALFHDFNQHGTTVLIATHDLFQVEKYHTRVLELKEGVLIRGFSEMNE